MRITRTILEYLNKKITDAPPETGGILGSSDGYVIDELILDLPNFINKNACSYFPNVEFLNKNIELWQKNSIYFMGIFHTHFFGVKTLSCGDKKYINAIMDAMPEKINFLYFPILVLPDREFVCYRADRKNKSIDISLEKLIVET